MRILLAFLATGVVFGAAWQAARQAVIQRESRRRLWAGSGSPAPAISRPARSILRRNPWAPCGIFIVVFAALRFSTPMTGLFCFSLASVACLVSVQVIDLRVLRWMTRIEEQLADGVDLMVSSLQAGAGAVGALENMTREIGSPLRDHLQETVARLQFGDNPASVFRNLGDKIPLETFRIFSLSMSVHWGTGGRLVPLLASVSKTLRDRVEISRQMRLQSTYARVSTFGILTAAYFIAYVIWRYQPEQFTVFVQAPVGNMMVSGSILLQAIGILWIHRMSQPKY